MRQRTHEANAAGIVFSSFRGRSGAGSEVKASLACEDRRLEGVSARRIRLQKSANDAEVQRSAIPLAKGRVDGDPNSLVLARAPWGGKGVDSRYRGGKATAPGRSEPGVRKGIAGRRPSQDGRHPGSSQGRSFTRAVLKATLAALEGQVRASVTWPLGERQGCQRQGMHAS